MFGMALATHIILTLSNWPNFEPLAVKNREGTYAKIYKELLVREATVFNQKYVIQHTYVNDRIALIALYLGRYRLTSEILRISLKRCG
jgi:hypothetical protein